MIKGYEGAGEKLFLDDLVEFVEGRQEETV